MKLGIDFGKVIVASRDADGTEDTSFLTGKLEQALATPPSPGAFPAIRRLVSQFGTNNVWIVSKAGDKVSSWSKKWLTRHNFAEETGMRLDHVRFCKERHQKADHCKQLGITHFIDDRADVLQHLRGIVPNLYLFGVQRPGTVVPEWAVEVKTWDAVVSSILTAPDGSTPSGAAGGLAPPLTA